MLAEVKDNARLPVTGNLWYRLQIMKAKADLFPDPPIEHAL